VEVHIDSFIPDLSHILGKPKVLYNAFRGPPMFLYKELMEKSIYNSPCILKFHLLFPHKSISDE